MQIEITAASGDGVVETAGRHEVRFGELKHIRHRSAQNRLLRISIARILFARIAMILATAALARMRTTQKKVIVKKYWGNQPVPSH